MQQTSYTPGPWLWDTENSLIAPPDADSREAELCKEHGSHWTENAQAVLMIGLQTGETEENGDWIYLPDLPPTQADAQLIAAAPDLFEALRDMVDACPVIDTHSKEAHEKALAAMHKAIGGL
jgi:hypothetical protein